MKGNRKLLKEVLKEIRHDMTNEEVLNLLAVKAFDPFPFILLNLVLSCVAAIQAPLIMMSQNRQEEKDRQRAENDYKVNLKTEIMIEDLYTLTVVCFLVVRKMTFSEKYFGEEEAQEQTTQERTEELLRIYNDIVRHCNELSEVMERDDSGAVVYSGGVDSRGNAVDMEDKAIDVMQSLGKRYDQLDGYYPRPKAMFFSDFMCQMYMCGYYFPFSMEANYNDVMYIMEKPATMCHELAHIRGYIYEDEANFIAFLACVESDDSTFQYAGYLSVLNYVANDLYKTRLADPDSYAAAREAVHPLQVLQQVQEDNIFVTEEQWERINGKAVVNTETVDSVSDTLTNASLKLNGVSDGMISYNRVVELLLQWYGEKEEF